MCWRTRRRRPSLRRTGGRTPSTIVRMVPLPGRPRKRGRKAPPLSSPAKRPRSGEEHSPKGGGGGPRCAHWPTPIRPSPDGRTGTRFALLLHMQRRIPLRCNSAGSTGTAGTCRNASAMAYRWRRSKHCSEATSISCATRPSGGAARPRLRQRRRSVDFLRVHLARRPHSPGERPLHARQGGQALCRRNFPT